MAPLRVIPYNYVPTKRRPCNNDQRSNVDKHPGTHHITQQSRLGVLPEKALQSLIAKSPGNARGAGEKSKHDNVYKAITDKPARQGIQDPASVPNAEVSLSGVITDQDTLDKETDYGQVKFTGMLNHTQARSRRIANQRLQITILSILILRATSTSISTPSLAISMPFSKNKKSAL
jgi:hypothetical protein